MGNICSHPASQTATTDLDLLSAAFNLPTARDLQRNAMRGNEKEGRRLIPPSSFSSSQSSRAQSPTPCGTPLTGIDDHFADSDSTSSETFQSPFYREFTACRLPQLSASPERNYSSRGDKSSFPRVSPPSKSMGCLTPDTPTTPVTPHSAFFHPNIIPQPTTQQQPVFAQSQVNPGRIATPASSAHFPAQDQARSQGQSYCQWWPYYYQQQACQQPVYYYYYMPQHDMLNPTVKTNLTTSGAAAPRQQTSRSASSSQAPSDGSNPSASIQTDVVPPKQDPSTPPQCASGLLPKRGRTFSQSDLMELQRSIGAQLDHFSDTITKKLDSLSSKSDKTEVPAVTIEESESSKTTSKKDDVNTKVIYPVSQQNKELSSSAQQSLPASPHKQPRGSNDYINDGARLTHHTCTGCGQIRSAGFHRLHPIVLIKPRANYCRDCMKDRMESRNRNPVHLCWSCGVVRSKAYHDKNPIRGGDILEPNYCNPCIEETIRVESLITASSTADSCSESCADTVADEEDSMISKSTVPANRVCNTETRRAERRRGRSISSVRSRPHMTSPIVSNYRAPTCEDDDPFADYLPGATSSRARVLSGDCDKSPAKNKNSSGPVKEHIGVEQASKHSKDRISVPISQSKRAGRGIYSGGKREDRSLGHDFEREVSPSPASRNESPSVKRHSYSKSNESVRGPPPAPSSGFVKRPHYPRHESSTSDWSRPTGYGGGGLFGSSTFSRAHVYGVNSSGDLHGHEQTSHASHNGPCNITSSSLPESKNTEWKFYASVDPFSLEHGLNYCPYPTQSSSNLSCSKPANQSRAWDTTTGGGPSTSTLPKFGPDEEYLSYEDFIFAQASANGGYTIPNSESEQSWMTDPYPEVYQPRAPVAPPLGTIQEVTEEEAKAIEAQVAVGKILTPTEDASPTAGTSGRLSQVAHTGHSSDEDNCGSHMPPQAFQYT